MKLFEACILARAARDGITEAPCSSLSAETPRFNDQASDGHRCHERDRPNSEPVSCFSCGHYDGAGAFWPGLCRYFETIGQEAKEIDFNVVDVVHGCKCYTARPMPKVVHSVERQRLKGDDPEWIRGDGEVYSESLKLSRPPYSPKQGGRISPVALEWLQEHRQALRQTGWTGRELYRRNKSKGIAWCDQWNKPFFKAYLHDDGVIEFEFVDGGRDVILTARPLSSWPKI